MVGVVSSASRHSRVSAVWVGGRARIISGAKLTTRARINVRADSRTWVRLCSHHCTVWGIDREPVVPLGCAALQLWAESVRGRNVEVLLGVGRCRRG